MVKLLFITQKVDKDDDVLGVYHRWVEKFSEKVGEIAVICLYRGKVDLPSNVLVYSLGKDKLRNADLRGWRRGFTRIKYVARFWKYIWNLRNDYDTVFVHMNPVYIVFGGCFWKLWGKKIMLWYNHPMGNLTAKIGIKLADKVFCTSSYSFAAKYGKTVLMPVGIDIALFKPLHDAAKKHNRILFLGRISPIKRVEVLIEAVKILDSQGVDFEVLIVGSPSSPKDKEYELKLKKMASELISKGKIVFQSSIPNYKTPDIYNNSAVFINLTPTGSFDKTTLEAMACGLPILASNKIFESLLPEAIKNFCVFKEDNPQDLSEKISFLFSLGNSEMKDIGKQFRELIVMNHGLDNLIENLAVIFDKTQQDKNQSLKINA